MTAIYGRDDLIQALATPRGRGAIAVIRTSGPGCAEAVAPFFSRSDDLTSSPGYRVLLGWFRDSSGELIDEVLLTVFRAPFSYTGEDSLEISCHGGPVVVDRVMDILRRAGFRDAAPGEFTYRAFASGKMDLTRAEAVREIIDARTDRARALATSRLAGSVAGIVDRAKGDLKRQAAIASLVLDYPEDETGTVDFDSALLRRVREELAALLDTWRTGRLYRDGLTVVLAGPANAGKSSLFNLFLREERSIVTETPGTTRDWLEAWLNLDGLPVRFIDTAGLRDDPGDAVEIEGVRRSRELIAAADLVIAVADGTAGADAAAALERKELALLADHTEADSGPGRLIRVWNKADLAPVSPEGWVAVSAVTGSGFADLERMLTARALGGGRPPESDAPVIDSARQRQLLRRAVGSLERLLEGIDAAVPVDLLAEDLHDALDALGEITGAVTRIDVLETLFSEFCVGK